MTVIDGSTPGHPKVPDILVPSFERELLRMAGHDERAPELHERLDENVRLAVLFSGSAALVPAPGFFETECGLAVLRSFVPSMERGQLLLLGFGGGPADYAQHKLRHWAGDAEQLASYASAGTTRIAALDGAAWRTKAASTDEQLLDLWHRALNDGTHPLLPLWRKTRLRAGGLERRLAELPQALDGTAMLLDNVVARLPERMRTALTPADRHRLRLFLARGFFSSYLNDDRAVTLVDARLGDNLAALPSAAPSLTFRRLRGMLEPLGLDRTLLLECTHSQLAVLADTAVWQSMATNLHARASNGTPYSSEDLIALRRVREPRRRQHSGAAPPDWLKRLLELQLSALDQAGKGSRAFTPGGSRTRSLLSLPHPTPKERPMSGVGFNSRVNNSGTIINVVGDSSLVIQDESSRNALVQALNEVFAARTERDASERLASAERTLAPKREVTSEHVAELIRRDLGGPAERLPDPVRQVLMSLGTSTGAGVLAQGIMLGLRALIGS